MALLGKADLALLELVEHVALRDRTKADVLDLADRRLFLHIHVDDPALGGGLALNAQIVKISGVPQRVEVPFQGCLVVNIPGPGEHAGFDGLRRDAPVAADGNLDDHVVLLCRAGARKDEKSEDKAYRDSTTAGPANQ